MPELIPCISLWQPWASAIACGSKKYETRSWPFPKRLAGQVVAVHAARRWAREEREWAAELHAFGVDLGFEGTPPLGCVVALARLVEAVPTESVFAPEFDPRAGIYPHATLAEYYLGNYEPGRWAWKLADVVAVAPVPIVGRQGFFSVPADLFPEEVIRGG